MKEEGRSIVKEGPARKSQDPYGKDKLVHIDSVFSKSMHTVQYFEKRIA